MKLIALLLLGVVGTFQLGNVPSAPTTSPALPHGYTVNQLIEASRRNDRQQQNQNQQTNQSRRPRLFK